MIATRLIGALALVGLLVGTHLGIARAQSAIPVIVGTDGPDWDACGAVGRVVGLNPDGDNFLAVRSGPSTDFTKIDEVYTNDALWLCEKRGRWWGVVYAADGHQAPCGVSSSVPAPIPYRGECRSGWVFDLYVELVAG